MNTKSINNQPIRLGKYLRLSFGFLHWPHFHSFVASSNEDILLSQLYNSIVHFILTVNIPAGYTLSWVINVDFPQRGYSKVLFI